MYVPAIVSADPIERFELGEYTALLLGNIQAEGLIQYLYVLAIYPKNSREPCYFITSETNMMAKDLGGESHFLCAFDGDRHLNFGCSNDWAEQQKFTEKALDMAKERFAID